MDNLKLIRTDADHAAALREIEAYFRTPPQPGTPDGDRFELLAFLIERYEEEAHPIEAPDPVEAIRVRMADMGLSQKALSAAAGIAESKISEVLSRRRGMSLPMIRSLSAVLKIPVAVLVQEYPLMEAA